MEYLSMVLIPCTIPARKGQAKSAMAFTSGIPMPWLQKLLQCTDDVTALCISLETLHSRTYRLAQLAVHIFR